MLILVHAKLIPPCISYVYTAFFNESQVALIGSIVIPQRLRLELSLNVSFELSRLPQLLKAVDMPLALAPFQRLKLVLAPRARKASCFDGEKQRWYFTLDTQLVVRVWALDLGASSPLPLFLPTWTALATRASDLMLCDNNLLSAAFPSPHPYSYELQNCIILVYDEET